MMGRFLKDRVAMNGPRDRSRFRQLYDRVRSATVWGLQSGQIRAVSDTGSPATPCVHQLLSNALAPESATSSTDNELIELFDCR